MAALNPARWAALSPQIDELLTLPPLQRAQRLDEIAANDPRTANELRELLAASADASRVGFMGGAADAGLAPPAPAHSAQAGAVLGAWTLVEAIGEGGMGAVWRARRSDGRFDGEAAIKLLKSGLFDPATQERFRREGALLARLRHPGIAQLLDAGVSSQGQPYLVLELVQGQRIDHWCEAQGLNVPQRIELFLQVLDAVQAAHAQLTIHRDLKPSNILVDDSGRVKLLDFGIARLLPEAQSEQTALTREGSFALTPEYAAPEQFEGGVLSVATDVYGLGVVLFELLAGTNPLALAQGSAPLQWMQAALDGPRQRASTVAPADRRTALRGDLDTILDKALRRLPAERYAGVVALADDLRKHLQHFPISARPVGVAERLGMLSRRHRLATALAGVAATAVLAGVMGTTAMAWRAQRNAQEARVERVRADEQARQAIGQRDLALAERARAQDLGALASYIAQAAPAGKPLTMTEVIGRSADFIQREAGLAPERRARLLGAVGDLFTSIDDFGRAEQALVAARSLARQTKNAPLRADISCSLAMAVGRGRRHDEARAALREGLAQLEDTAANVASRIGCLQMAADVESDAGEAARAAQLAIEARDLLPRLEIPNLEVERNTWSRVATTQMVAGRIGPALQAFDQVGRLLRQDQRDQSDAARLMFTNWGVTLAVAGQPLQAERVLREGLHLGDQPQALAALPPTTLMNYARVLLDLGHAARAEPLLAQAAERAETLGDQSIANLARWHRVRALRALGRIDEAGTLLDGVAARWQAGLPPTHYLLGLVPLERAVHALARGQAARADALLDESVQLLRKSRSAALYVPQALTRRAEARLRREDASGALADAEAALAMHRTNLGDGLPSAGRGDALMAQGRALLVQGQSAAAGQQFAAAVQQYVPSLGRDHPRTEQAQQLVKQQAGQPAIPASGAR
jgi:tetratricopeptide (TPR) repeat protein